VRVFVSAWIGSENIGDELLFAVLRQRLEQLGAEVVVASKHPALTERKHRVRAVHHYDAWAIGRALFDCDALVFGGGGLIQDATSALSLPYHLSRPLLAKAEGVPFIGMGLGVGPLRLRFSKVLLPRALAGHDGITVRDEHSARLLRSCGVDGVNVTADMVFSLEPPGEPARDQIALALRSYTDGLLPERYRLSPIDERLEGALARALDEVSRRTRLHLRFLAFEGRRDEAFNRRVANRMHSKDSSFATTTPETIMQEMSQARLAIAMRYHGGVTAVVAERPVVLIGYAPKVAALADALGDDCRYIAHDEQAIAALPPLVEELLASRSQTLSITRQRLRHIEAGNLDLLQTFLRDLPGTMRDKDVVARVGGPMT
jgi:polysaccharide pyruvyl transferase CsaB